MTIYLANIAQDGTRSYRTDRHGIVAFAAHADAIINLKSERPTWGIFGNPTARDGLFLLARAGLAISNVGIADPDGMLLASDQRWHPMSEAEIEEFAA